jgi:S-phase kinase-associated protein 1
LYGCQAVAAQIKGKSPEEIRSLLGLPNDLTEEEKDAIRRENVWCSNH